MYHHYKLTLIFLSDVAALGQNIIAVAAIYSVKKIKVLFYKAHKGRLLIRDEGGPHRIQVRHGMAVAVLLPIFFIFQQYQHFTLFPVFEFKRSCTHRVAAEILPITINHFMRYHAAILRGKQAQQRRERLLQFYSKRAIIQSNKTAFATYLITEYPRSR